MSNSIQEALAAVQRKINEQRMIITYISLLIKRLKRKVFYYPIQEHFGCSDFLLSL